MDKADINPRDHVAEYKRLYGKEVPNRYKNDSEWITSKVDDARLANRETRVKEDLQKLEKKHQEAEQRDYVQLKEEGNSVHVIVEGKYLRTYSKFEHGANYRELAEQFKVVHKRKIAERNLRARGMII